MSELILHDMHMPKEGDVIRIVKNDHGQLLAEYLTDGQLMTSFHPLRELKSPHGRIIDEDDFVEQVTRYFPKSLKYINIDKALEFTKTILPKTK